MDPDTSMQNWMFVMRRLVFGAPIFCGPASMMIATARSSAGRDSASLSEAPRTAPRALRPSPTTSSKGIAMRPPRRVQTQPSSAIGAISATR